ncbi:MAG: hypothetical protein WKF84_08510 [Pyrinomonadaceae bacterium]
MLSAELGYDELIGAVKLNSRWRFFAGTPAEWTLDYAAYDPTYNAEKTTAYVFRNGLLRVDEANAAEFCEAMKNTSFPLLTLRFSPTKEARSKRRSTGGSQLRRKIVRQWIFDGARRTHTSGLEGRLRNPEDYIPPEIRVAWQSLK